MHESVPRLKVAFSLSVRELPEWAVIVPGGGDLRSGHAVAQAAERACA